MEASSEAQEAICDMYCVKMTENIDHRRWSKKFHPKKDQHKKIQNIHHIVCVYLWLETTVSWVDPMKLDELEAANL